MKFNFKTVNKFIKWYKKQALVTQVVIGILGIVLLIALIQVIYELTKTITWLIIIIGLAYIFLKFYKKKG